MKVGVIGGSGLYEMEGLKDVREEKIETPFGDPSDPYICGTLGEAEIYFLPRHGRGHRLTPSEINHRANICGFKMLGVDRIIAVTAVGSLKQELRPRDVILPDQYFDRTKQSQAHTFFGDGIVGHASFGDPICQEFHKLAADAARKVVGRQLGSSKVKMFEMGTYVNMEGPAFSTRAESKVYRSFGFDVIGMTSLGEAKLCREAEICYQTLGMITDYDCWHESEEPVTADAVVGHLMANTALAKQILQELILSLPETRSCRCGTSLAGAIVTNPAVIPEATRVRLASVMGKYLG